MKQHVATAKQSVRLSGGLPLLIGSALLLVSLAVPWAVGGSDRNAFEYMPPVAFLWAMVGLWGLGAALSLARADGARGLVVLAALASISLLADLVIVLGGMQDPVVGVLGGGPSLALIGLTAMVVGIWQVDDASPAEEEQHPQG
jgi:hypothetical protein